MEEKFLRTGVFGAWVKIMYRCLMRNPDLISTEIEEVRMCKDNHILVVVGDRTFTAKPGEIYCQNCQNPMQVWKLESEPYSSV